ncbi:hypothetical protein [Pseudotenacibaculum haliotis]|uniref:DUF1320 domain-containing protein n=1 Tax=Pseudotenacibaculum haliotis TaxID=1862138 RepID=A0ABW5LMK5_9FLAO
MIYLTEDDLKTDSRNRFIQESTGDFDKALENAEKRAIGKVKPYLRDLYDVEAIFDETAPIKDEALVDILVTLTLAKIHSRNSARKFNISKDDMEQVQKELDKIAAGKITLDLPKPTDDDGQVESTSIWGNLTNDDFYI